MGQPKRIRGLRWVRIVALLLTIVTIGPGCVSYHALPFVDEGSAATLVEHKQRDGLFVAVQNLASERSATRHFQRDLQGYGVLPVLLLMELDAESKSAFNIRRDELRLVLRDGTRLKSVAPSHVVDDVSYSHWRSFFAYLFLLPGPFVSSSVNQANADLEEDYLRKSLRSIRVSQNLRSYRGVVFFEVPEELDELVLEDAFVELVAYREARRGAEGQEAIGERLDFPVHFPN